MRKLLLTCVFTSLSAGVSWGVVIDFKNQNNGVWSTGFQSNVALVNVLDPDTTDPHYVLIPPSGCVATDIHCQRADGVLFGPNSYVTIGSYPAGNAGGWPFANDSTAGPTASQWIGPRADQTNPPQRDTGTWNTVNPYAHPSEFYVYRVTFNLSLLGLAGPGNFNIQLKWLSDNPDGLEGVGGNQSFIRLCSGLSGANSTGAAGACNTVSTGNLGQSAPNFDSSPVININGNYTGGWYSLDFIVYNAMVGPNEANPTGLRVQILSAQAGDGIPEPATIGLVTSALIGMAVYSRRKR